MAGSFKVTANTKEFFGELQANFVLMINPVKAKVRARADAVAEVAKQLAPKSAEELANSIVVVPAPGIGGKGGAAFRIVVQSAHGEHVEFGTSEYDTPPKASNLLDWVERHPDFLPGVDRKRASYVLSDLIFEHGTPEQPFLVPAIEMNRPGFAEEIVATLESEARKLRVRRPTKKG